MNYDELRKQADDISINNNKEKGLIQQLIEICEKQQDEIDELKAHVNFLDALK